MIIYGDTDLGRMYGDVLILEESPMNVSAQTSVLF